MTTWRQSVILVGQVGSQVLTGARRSPRHCRCRRAEYTRVLTMHAAASYWIEELDVDWYVYIVRCGDASLYTGVTSDIFRRVAEHNAGRGARYTRAHLPVALAAAWRLSSRAEAMAAELALKRLERSAKLRLIEDRASFRGATYAADIMQEALA